MGTWYEIARYPNLMQAYHKCELYNITFHDNGAINVVAQGIHEK